MAPKRSPAVDRRAPGIAAARVPWERPTLSQEYRSGLLVLARRGNLPPAPLRASAVLPVTWLSSSYSAETSEPSDTEVEVVIEAEIVEDRAASLLASVW